jgi:hypothetical protein
MTKVRFALAFACALTASPVPAISLDDIQLWTGSGTNRAAVVIDWNTPEAFNQTTVPAPVADKTLVWGYRFDGTTTGDQMFNAIVAANPQLYAVEDVDPVYGVGVKAIGFNLDNTGIAGIGGVTNTFTTSSFTNGVLVVGAKQDVDGFYPLDKGDLFWSGFNGPYWQLWNESGDNGGFSNSPNRGSSAYWDPNAYAQGEWDSAYLGLSDLPITNGSWVGFSISAAGYPSTNDPNYSADMAIFNNDEQAPPSPDGTYVAYVCNTNDFAAQVSSTNDLDPYSPYNNPAAVLGRPTLQFYDPYDGDVTDRVSIIDDPFNVTPQGADVITEIGVGGEITVQLGRKIYHNPSNPYGIDLIVYGNSFFSGVSHTSGPISDSTDLSVATLTSSSVFGHGTTVSVSQDGVSWYPLPSVPSLFPDNAYRWDDTNASWTAEFMNPNKPINPILYTNKFAGETVATALDQFVGASGGTGFSLQSSGLPWIQYVQIQPNSSTNYTVIDAIAAVNPVAVGDALSVAPDNVASGTASLAFQSPGNSGQNQISINFDSVGGLAKISTVGLSEFSSFAPVSGTVSSAYKIQSRAIGGTGGVTYSAEVGLRAGNHYSGNGSDLRVYQWNCTNWISTPFSFSAANNEVLLSGVTNFSAYVVSQIIPPGMSIQASTNGFAFQFAPVPNCTHILERSTDLIHWTPVSTNVVSGAQAVVLQDTNAPAGQSFYRLQVNVP